MIFQSRFRAETTIIINTILMMASILLSNVIFYDEWLRIVEEITFTVDTEFDFNVCWRNGLLPNYTLSVLFSYSISLLFLFSKSEPASCFFFIFYKIFFTFLIQNYIYSFISAKVLVRILFFM